MKRYFGPLLFLVAGFLFFPAGALAAPATAELKGRILLDVSGHGEAWYVNPQTLMRVYLGRPDEALARLQERTIRVTYDNITRLAEAAGDPTDAAYAAEVSGFVLTPSDLIGASWYVDPAAKARRRLASGADAWEIMKQGLPVSAKTLASIDVEPSMAPATVEAKVKEITSATTLKLEDGATVRLLSVEVPANPDLQQAAMSKLSAAIAGKSVMLESDVETKDADGTLLRFVSAGGVNLSYDLVRNGLAFYAIAEPNYKYAEMLIVGSLDAARGKKGFWSGEYLKNL